jgi:hypothetical protein
LGISTLAKTVQQDRSSSHYPIACALRGRCPRSRAGGLRAESIVKNHVESIRRFGSKLNRSLTLTYASNIVPGRLSTAKQRRQARMPAWHPEFFRSSRLHSRVVEPI